MLRGLLRLPLVRELVFAPDIGRFFAVGNEVRFENTTLLQQPGEPDSRVETLLTINTIRGNMGTVLDGQQLAHDAAALFNKARSQASRAYSHGA